MFNWPIFFKLESIPIKESTFAMRLLSHAMSTSVYFLTYVTSVYFLTYVTSVYF